MTVEESLDFVGCLRGMRAQNLKFNKKFLIELLELHNFRKDFVHSLSAGTKRKLCFAQAMLLVPKCLFLDEITTSMDPISRRGVNKTFKDL